jgi:hypothetical protein
MRQLTGKEISSEALELIVEEITRSILERLSNEEIETDLGYHCTGWGYTCGRYYKCVGDEHECTGHFTCLVAHEWKNAES